MSGEKVDFNELEALARENRWPEIEKKIQSADRHLFLRKDTLNLATLARRAYRLSFASYLLKPWVLDPDCNIKKNAGDEMVAEYAVIQSMLGGHSKALELLKSIETDTVTSSFAWVTYYFSQQNYEETIPFLRLSIEEESDAYKKKVAELNLAACLTNSGLLDEAHSEIETLKNYFQENNYTLLLANTKEVWGQILIQQGQWKQAQNVLLEAKKLMSGQNRLYSLFIDKWLLISQFKENKLRQKDVLLFIDKAKDLGHFHSVREILFYWAFINDDKKLIEKIYFATPYASYRKMIEKQIGRSINSQHCDWNSEYFNHDSLQTLNLQRSPGHNIRFSPQEFKLLLAFCKNLFEPQSVSSLFYEIYPDEYFDPEFSPAKTYKVLKRLKTKLHELPEPISIENRNSKYSLRASQDMALRLVHPDRKTLSRSVDEFNILQQFGSSEFSRQDVMDSLNLTKTTALRLIKELQAQRKIIKMGRGPYSFYQVAS